jgi:hypothetical protein
MQGTQVLTLASEGESDRVVFRAKWRPFAAGPVFSEPRHALAVFRLQTLLLEPADYVAPPTAGRCIPLEEYRRSVDPRATETFAGAGCVFGVLSYWLEEVHGIEDAHDDGWMVGADSGGLFDPVLFHDSDT